MNDTKRPAWNTKYGVRRVRQEEPSVEDAIAAAQGLTDDRDEQVEIAASLIGLPQEEVRAAMLKLAPARKEQRTASVTIIGPGSRPRVVVVETKRPRRTALTQR